jgi:hypothetical protein
VYKYDTASVVQWSEFLTTNTGVPGSIKPYEFHANTFFSEDFLKILFNIILLPSSSSSEWFIPYRFPDRIFLYAFLTSEALARARVWSCGICGGQSDAGAGGDPSIGILR